MRTHFFNVNTKKQAEKLALYSLYKIVKVEGGYLGFETYNDYKTWKNQK